MRSLRLRQARPRALAALGVVLAVGVGFFAARWTSSSGGRGAGASPLVVRCVGPDGAPCPGAQVRFDSSPWLPTDGEGILATDWAHAGLTVRARVPDRLVSAPVDLEPLAASVVLVLEPGGVLAGRVVDVATGEPIPDVELTLEIGDDWTERGWSSGAGSYRFGGIPLATPVLLTAEDGPRARTLFSFTSEAPATGPAPREKSTPVVAANLIRPGEIHAEDVSAIRRPGVELAVRLEPPEGGELPEVLWVDQALAGAHSGQWHREYRPDPADPTITLFLPRGHDTVLLLARGLFAVAAIRDVGGDGPREEEALRLRRRVPVHAQIVSAGGEAVRGAGVPVGLAVVRGTTELVHFAPTDESGVADLTDLLPPPDPRLLGGVRLGAFLAAADGARFRGGPELPNRPISTTEYRAWARAGEPVTIEVPRLDSREVVVALQDGEGRPLAGIEVQAEPAGDFVADRVTSDRNGEVRIGVRGLHGAGPRAGEKRDARLTVPSRGDAELDLARALRQAPAGAGGGAPGGAPRVVWVLPD